MTYLLCHGFGFDHCYWENLIPLLDDKYEFFDENFRVHSEKCYIGIGHSLGFLKLNNSGINVRALVGLQGFLNFCGHEPAHRENLQKNLDRMIEKCTKIPLCFLEFFHKLCGYDQQFDFRNISKENLLQDLEMMKNSYEHCGAPTLIIGSHEDKVVEHIILKDNFENRKNIQIKYIDGVNHTLGFSKPNETFELIKRFLKEIP